MTQSFGFLLRQYRNKSIDPQNGRRLSQEALGLLIGKDLGTQHSYSAQAISDWERDKSQIHKDHRQVLLAIIHNLHTCGGLATPEDAETLLAAGNYRSLTEAEVTSIFQKEAPGPSQTTCETDSLPLPFDLPHLRKALTPTTLLKATMVVLAWAATRLSIAPVLDFSISDPSLRLRYTIMLAVSGLVIPAILTWISSLKSTTSYPLTTRFKAYLTSLLGFSLGLSNILALALVSYNLTLYPWPGTLILCLSLWPIVMALSLANLDQQPELASQRIRYRWALPALPVTISAALYSLHPLLSDRLMGPFLAISFSLALGVLLWSQTRK
jgi:hypothetical protein